MRPLAFACTFALLAACGNKTAATPAPEPEPEPTEMAEPEPTEAAEPAPATGDEEPIICCHFNDAYGTSTASSCEEYGGEVVDASNCP